MNKYFLFKKWINIVFIEREFDEWFIRWLLSEQPLCVLIEFQDWVWLDLVELGECRSPRFFPLWLLVHWNRWITWRESLLWLARHPHYFKERIDQSVAQGSIVEKRTHTLTWLTHSEVLIENLWKCAGPDRVNIHSRQHCWSVIGCGNTLFQVTHKHTHPQG